MKKKTKYLYIFWEDSWKGSAKDKKVENSKNDKRKSRQSEISKIKNCERLP